MRLKVGLLLFTLLSATSGAAVRSCDSSAGENEGYSTYFQGLKAMYGIDNDRVYKCYMDCGWPQSTSKPDLPTLVVAVGLEASGQKMWLSSVFNSLVKSDSTICSSDDESSTSYGINGGKNFPLLTSEDLSASLDKEFSAKSEKCRLMFDFSHSFPLGNKKHTGRVMRHGDLVTLQQLHGVKYNVKYLVLIRNVADSAMASLSRQTVRTIDHNLRAVEASLVYLEAALNQIPCEQKFLAHFEKFRVDPRSFLEPLKSFLNLNQEAYNSAAENLASSIDTFAKLKKTPPAFKFARELVPQLCSRRDSDKKCNKEVQKVYSKFFALRAHMWPTFAGQ